MSWKALHAQFGTGFARVYDFRTTFALNLQLALSVYPDAKVDIQERGLKEALIKLLSTRSRNGV